MARTILAVLLGWAAVAGLVLFTDLLLMQIFPDDYVPGRRPPDWLALWSLAASFLWSVAGGWICARIARYGIWRHAACLTALGLLIGAVSTYLSWGRIQAWYQFGLLLLWPLAVSLGAWLRTRQLPASSR
jgi:hypothetical protein